MPLPLESPLNSKIVAIVDSNSPALQLEQVILETYYGANVYPTDSLRGHFFEVIKELGVQAVILHNIAPPEGDSVIAAFRNGLAIVVLERLAKNDALRAMYAEFQDQGIPIIDRIHTDFEVIIATLEKQLSPKRAKE